MKGWDKIYDEMSLDAQDVADYIDSKLSDVCQEDIRSSDEIRQNAIRLISDAIDKYWDEPLAEEERQSMLEYVKARYGICM